MIIAVKGANIKLEAVVRSVYFGETVTTQNFFYEEIKSRLRRAMLIKLWPADHGWSAAISQVVGVVPQAVSEEKVFQKILSDPERMKKYTHICLC
jgi:hypothetical protein